MNKIVLDASALLAAIQGELGAEIIRPLLKISAMSTVNVAEVLTALQRTNIPPSQAKILVNDIISDIVLFDLDQACYTAELQRLTSSRGLSLGDRACIALGIKLGAPIYTADKIWSELQIEGAIITLIR